MHGEKIAIAKQILVERVGVLAELVVEDALADTHADPQAEPLQWLREFILRVTKGLPDSVNRAEVIVELRRALIPNNPNAKE